MTGFSSLALVEAKLFLREKAALLGVFGLPVALVIGFGLIPGFSAPQKGLSDQIGTEYIAAIGVAIVLAILGLTGVPTVIGQYRERGVRAAARGEAVLSPSVATRLIGQVREPSREPLSQRELDVLALIARGCSNREAAARLFISEATVKTHVLHIYAKLGVNDRAAAVAAGFERGLLPRP